LLDGGTQLEADSRTAPGWRRWLVYSLGTALLLKLVALLVIKSTFFSAASEPEVTPRLVDEHLAVHPSASQPTAAEPSR
jgi:hypothetical protein